jgi:hypothetical protein
MKLQEKFSVINCSDCDMPYCDIKCTILTPSELNRLEQIADEFAIGFAEWVDINYFIYNTWDKSKTTTELLEIYKKEKGL